MSVSHSQFPTMTNVSLSVAKSIAALLLLPLLAFAASSSSSSEVVDNATKNLDRFLEPAEATAAPTVKDSYLCDNPFVDPNTLICEPDCYCIPDVAEGPDDLGCDVCPDLGNRQFTYLSGVDGSADFFESLEPEDGTLFEFSPPGCNPFPVVAATFGTVPCEGVTQPNPPSNKSGKSDKSGKKDKKKKGSKKDHMDGPVTACSFKYKGRNVCRSRTYALVEGRGRGSTKSSKKSSKSVIHVTHEGTCGVCSGAQDLATNLSPTLLQDSGACSGLATALLAADPDANFPIVLPTLQQCFLDLGFTLACAFLWASNSLNLILELNIAVTGVDPISGGPYAGPPSCASCATICLVDPLNPTCVQPFVPGTCQLSPCVDCDEELNGAIFKGFGGRTRRNSGIITTFPQEIAPGVSPFVGLKRPCSTNADIGQPVVDCPADED